jgi:hypothetical protein
MMNRRLYGMSLGLALLALVALGTIAGRGVFAQDGTPTPTAEETPERSPFLDAFAAQFGVTDQAQIDAAIQAALSQVLDEKVAAGELTQAEADAIKERVAAGEVRIRVGLFGGPRDHDGLRGGEDHRGQHDRDENEDETTEPATPAAGLTPAV